jgi:putative ABC transport system permease protein
MSWVALKMLTGNRAKYLGVVFGIAFGTLLITQQSSIFCGAMLRTISQIHDIADASIWVMDPSVEYVDDNTPLRDRELYRVRSVPGVLWAVRLYKGISQVRLADGNYQQVVLIGLDDETLIGAPREMVVGSVADLRQPDAILMDEAGYRFLWPGDPLRPGKTVEINERRAVVVGICKASATFILSNPVVYSRFSQASVYAPRSRNQLSFVLAQNEPALTPADAARRIERHTGLRALPREDFAWRTIVYYLVRTGVAINFGTTVMLGVFIGSAIAGQMFYTFTVENLRHFGTLKALGVNDRRLVGMVILQAFWVGAIGYGLGVGGAALFGQLTRNATKLAFFMHWQVLVGTGVAVILIVIVTSLFSIWRVLFVEPATVFRS